MSRDAPLCEKSNRRWQKSHVLAVFLTNSQQLLPSLKTRYGTFLAQGEILRNREKKKRGH